MLGGRGTVANFWHTDVQKNNVQKLSVYLFLKEFTILVFKKGN